MTSPKGLELSGLDGTNPLGFLAAVGTLVVVQVAGEHEACLRWTKGRTWTPVLDGITVIDQTRFREKFSENVAHALRNAQVTGADDEKRGEAKKAFDQARTAVKKKSEEIKKRGLRGKERKAAIEAEVRPLEKEQEEKRKAWLDALKKAVPRPELALGSRIDCTPDEYREHACNFRAEATREALDFLAAFGSDACREEKGKAIRATPFCFIRGSGHQEFLETVSKLHEKVDPTRVRQALFEPWTYRDSGLSMRWDPHEDRRYALMDVKPADEGVSTMWMANLLAYRGLVLFPCAPIRSGLATTAWTTIDEEEVLTWPIWEFPASPDAVRTLLQLRELAEACPDAALLRARGIATVFRARRTRFPRTGASYKWSFSPARACW
jgi:hypothetical protein